MHRFLIVIETAGNNFSAYSPDLPDLGSRTVAAPRPWENEIHVKFGSLFSRPAGRNVDLKEPPTLSPHCGVAL